MALTISAADIVQQLRARFGIRGLTDLSVEQSVVPVTNVGDLDNAPWNSKGGFYGVQNQAAVAAQFPYGIIAFPSNATGVTAVIRELSISSAASTVYRLALVNQAFVAAAVGGGGGGGFSWDSPRNPSQNNPPSVVTDMNRTALQLLSATNAADIIPANGYDVIVQTGIGARLNLPWVIRPGSCLLIRGSTVNVQFGFSVFADEYRDE